MTTLTREQGYAANTDRELWREREGDYYADSIHVTESGAIGINCGGHVIVLPVRKWHAFALQGLEQRGAADGSATRQATTRCSVGEKSEPTSFPQSAPHQNSAAQVSTTDLPQPSVVAPISGPAPAEPSSPPQEEAAGCAGTPERSPAAGGGFVPCASCGSAWCKEHRQCLQGRAAGGDTPTPLVDAWEFDVPYLGGDTMKVVRSEFARDLERVARRMAAALAWHERHCDLDVDSEALATWRELEERK